MRNLDSSTPSTLRKWLRLTGIWALLSSLFLVVAAWSLWPAIRCPRQILPAGSSDCATVPMLNAWTIWWNADRLTHGLAGYWDAPIFFPEQGAFAFSEPQPATWIVAPIVWLNQTPVPAYRAYLLITLVLNAVFTVRLLRTLRTGWFTATVGGVAMLLHPLVHRYGDVLQLMPLWGALWTLESVLRLHRRPTRRRGLQLGLAFSSAFLTSVHHGLFLLLLLGLTIWITVPWKRRREWLVGAALAAVTAAVILAPLLWPMHQILQRHHFSRQTETVQLLSATTSQWLEVPSSAIVRFTRGQPQSTRQLSPGWLRVVLAAAGLLLCLRHPRRRPAVVFLAALAAVAFLWSLGVNLSFGSYRPWLTLCDWVPAFGLVRSPHRFAYFAQLAVILLAALGLDATFCCRWARFSRPQVRWALRGMVAACGVAVAMEIPPAPVELVLIPDVSMEQPWSTYLREHTPAGRSVVCLPVAPGNSLRELSVDARWMMYGTRHGVPLVNGYSGFFPESWFRMITALREAPFSDATCDMLAEAHVEFVVIRTREIGQRPPPPDESHRWLLTCVLRDASGVEIWRLSQRQTKRPL